MESSRVERAGIASNGKYECSAARVCRQRMDKLEHVHTRTTPLLARQSAKAYTYLPLWPLGLANAGSGPKASRISDASRGLHVPPLRSGLGFLGQRAGTRMRWPSNSNHWPGPGSWIWSATERQRASKHDPMSSFAVWKAAHLHWS